MRDLERDHVTRLASQSDDRFRAEVEHDALDLTHHIFDNAAQASELELNCSLVEVGRAYGRAWPLTQRTTRGLECAEGF